MEFTEENCPPKPRYCPVEIAYNNSSILMGGIGRTKNPDLMICPDECPGLLEVERAQFSPLRILYGATKQICGRYNQSS